MTIVKNRLLTTSVFAFGTAMAGSKPSGPNRRRWTVGSLPGSVALAALAILAPGRASALPGDLYVANWYNNTIEKFTPGGVGSVFANTGLSSPYALAFDNSANLYVANYGNSTIEKFTPGGVGSVFATTTVRPYALAFDAAGNLYAASLSSTIQKFAPNGVGSVFVNDIANPSGLAFDSAGNLFVSDIATNHIVKITQGGVESVFASTGLNDPQGLAFDASGNLYAASYGNSTIEKFTPGGVETIFASSGLTNPLDLAFDATGNLYAANVGSSNSTIEKFTPSGVGSVFASSGGTYVGPTGLAFEHAPVARPVPEPVSIALFGTGLLGLGMIRRRRAP
jgi:sugar lactone lactonase YvrE